jgi:hypothetical protein
MKRNAIFFGRILRISIGLTYSRFLIFALQIWNLATGYYPVEFKNSALAQNWIMGVLMIDLISISVLLYGVKHSVMVMRPKISIQHNSLISEQKFL